MLRSQMSWLLAWLLSIVASVSIGLIPGNLIGESLCGVWGCFPPVQALASLHLLWLVALMPPVWRWRGDDPVWWPEDSECSWCFSGYSRRHVLSGMDWSSGAIPPLTPNTPDMHSAVSATHWRRALTFLHCNCYSPALL